MQKLKLLLFALVSALMLMVSACASDDGGNGAVTAPSHITVTSIVASQNPLNIELNQTVTVNAIVTPNNATDDTYTLSSDNNTISINGNEITGISLGDAIVTIISNDNTSATSTFKVNITQRVPVTGLILSYPATILLVDDTLTPELSFTPSTTTQLDVTYAIDNVSFADINADTGVVTGKSSGTVKVTVTSLHNNAAIAEFSIIIHDDYCALNDMKGYNNVSGVWQIYNENGLIALRSNLTQDAKLVCDINLAGNASNLWTPIGDDTNRYNGTFDGDNHTISGLYISNSTNHQGLFGAIDTNGTVKNLVVDNAIITSGINVGAIAGLSNGRIENVASINGMVTGSSQVGGIIGYNSGILTASYNTSDVTASGGSGKIGGIAGMNNSKVSACYNTGSVSGKQDIGGIVGVSFGPSSAVSASYNTGNLVNLDLNLIPNMGGVIAHVETSNASIDDIKATYYLQSTASYGIDDPNDNTVAAPVSSLGLFKTDTNIAQAMNNNITTGYEFIVNPNGNNPPLIIQAKP